MMISVNISMIGYSAPNAALERTLWSVMGTACALVKIL